MAVSSRPAPVSSGSVLSPGVYVGPQAIVRESILFTDSSIEAGARVERAFLDKDVTVGHKAVVGRLINDEYALGIVSIGKNSQVPGGLQIGQGAMVGPDVRAMAFPSKGLAEGQALMRKTSPLGLP